MHIQHIDRSELASLASGPSRSWLAAALLRLLELPDHPRSRFLVALESGQIRAVLGLTLDWAVGGQPRRATIRVLEVDPEHGDCGIGSRLVRFAERIAHVRGYGRVHVAPDLVRWGAGSCWRSLGYDAPGRGLAKEVTPCIHRSCG